MTDSPVVGLRGEGDDPVCAYHGIRLSQHDGLIGPECESLADPGDARREGFGTVEGGVPLPESMKDMPMIPNKRKDEPLFEPRDARQQAAEPEHVRILQLENDYLAGLVAKAERRVQEAERALREIVEMHPVDSGLRAAIVARAYFDVGGDG